MKFIHREEIRITTYYLLFGLLWITLSDSILIWIFDNDPQILTKLQTYKGSFFVFITAILLYSLIHTSVKKLRQQHQKAEEARQKAEKLNIQKSRFLAQMSHEIRTPLNGLTGFASLLSTPSLTKEQREKYIGIIQNRSTHLLRVVNDLIDLSKLESNNLILSLEVIYLPTLLKELIEYYHPKRLLQNKKDLELHWNIQGNETITTDPTRLRQILINLLDNAIKYTPEGSIHLSAHVKEDDALFKVTDTGIGIPQEKQHLLFQQHVDIQNYLSNEHKGAGLGLSIAKSIVEYMNGNLWFTSKEHEGTTFAFTLPVTTSATSKKKFTQTTYAWEHLTVVIIEDDFTSHLYFKELLAPTGANLLIFSQGKKALRYLRKVEKTPIVLLDLKLPDISGFEILKAIHKEKLQIKTIVQTANIIQNEEKRCRELGCQHILTKPVPPDQLLKTIASQINNPISQ